MSWTSTCCEDVVQALNKEVDLPCFVGRSFANPVGGRGSGEVVGVGADGISAKCHVLSLGVKRASVEEALSVMGVFRGPRKWVASAQRNE